MIGQLRGRWEIFKFKWTLSKLKYIALAGITGGLLLSYNGDYGYVPAEYCSIYPYITYGIVILPLIIWFIEMELITNSNKEPLNTIRSKYGIKIKT